MVRCDWLVSNSFDWYILILAVLVGDSLRGSLSYSSPNYLCLDTVVFKPGSLWGRVSQIVLEFESVSFSCYCVS